MRHVMVGFTPVSATLGGILIGVASTLLLWGSGRIAGISGIVGAIGTAAAGDRAWRVLFIVGLLVGGVAVLLVRPEALDATVHRPLPILALAGLLVGFGTRLGNGCTSGHGVCGLSRFSKRSLVAVLVFMSIGAGTAMAAHALLGGQA